MPAALFDLPILGPVVRWILSAVIVPVRLEPVDFPPLCRSPRHWPGFRLQSSGLAIRLVLASSPTGVVGGPHVVYLAVPAPQGVTPDTASRRPSTAP